MIKRVLLAKTLNFHIRKFRNDNFHNINIGNCKATISETWLKQVLTLYPERVRRFRLYRHLVTGRFL